LRNFPGVFAFLFHCDQKSTLGLQQHKQPCAFPGEIMVANDKPARGLALRPISFILTAFLSMSCVSFAQKLTDEPQIRTSELDRQVRDFLHKEVSAHVADIKTLDPPPDHVVGALTTGEFSWGTFMRTLGVYA